MMTLQSSLVPQASKRDEFPGGKPGDEANYNQAAVEQSLLLFSEICQLFL